MRSARMRAPEFASTCCNCGPREAVLIGTMITPDHAQPRYSSRNSARFGHMTASRSPGFNPASRSRPAAAAASTGISAYDHVVSPMRNNGLVPYFAACRCSIFGRVRSAGANSSCKAISRFR